MDDVLSTSIRLPRSTAPKLERKEDNAAPSSVTPNNARQVSAPRLLLPNVFSSINYSKSMGPQCNMHKGKEPPSKRCPYASLIPGTSLLPPGCSLGTVTQATKAFAMQPITSSTGNTEENQHPRYCPALHCPQSTLTQEHQPFPSAHNTVDRAPTN